MNNQMRVAKAVRSGKRSKTRKGSALLEVLTVTVAVLFPLIYMSLDVTAVLIGYLQSMHVARDAARAAAAHSSRAAALQAANYRFKIARTNNIVTNLQLDGFEFVPDTSVNVRALVEVRLPAPLPEVSVVKLKAHALVPIFSSNAKS